jgi:hypothetical protein
MPGQQVDGQKKNRVNTVEGLQEVFRNIYNLPRVAVILAITNLFARVGFSEARFTEY